MRRFLMMGALVVVHLGGYVAANRLAAARGPEALFDVATPLDALVPHLPWTWPLYWIAWPYVLLGGARLLLALGPARFPRGVGAFLALLLTAFALHVAIPVRAPWPVQPHPVQQLFHHAPFVMPYGTCPSLHVALCTLVAIRGLATARGAPGRAVHVAAPLLVAVSTLTLKEHFVVDVAAGALLAAVVARAWSVLERRADARGRDGSADAVPAALDGGGQRDDLVGAHAALQPRL